MKKILGFVLVAALAACDTGEAFESQPWEAAQPAVSMPSEAPATSDEWPERAACGQPHPEHCAHGYIRAVASDVTIVLCQHVAGCVFSSAPCVHGRVIGNPETVVLCLDE